jgi:hypothetical protein
MGDLLVSHVLKEWDGWIGRRSGAKAYGFAQGNLMLAHPFGPSDRRQRLIGVQENLDETPH